MQHSKQSSISGEKEFVTMQLKFALWNLQSGWIKIA